MKLFICLLVIVAILFAGCSKEPEVEEVKNVLINSIVPSSGPAGTTVVIKGINFASAPSENLVKFNNTSAIVLSSSVDSLVVVAPANGTSGPVTVAVAGNIATGPVFTYTQPVDSVDVYVAARAYGVMYWKNGQVFLLATTQNNIGGAYGIAISDTNVYVGGYTHYSVSPGFQAAYWKNGQKTILTSPDSAGEVRALALSGSDLYAGGSENYKPVYWKNGVRYSLPTAGGGASRLNALAIDGNDVYAAGVEPGPANEVHSVYWKNGIRTVLGKNSPVDMGATSIAVNNNDVYVCATDSGAAVYWKNGVRVELDKFPGEIVRATAVAIAGNDIYVVGIYGRDAVVWKNGTRITLPKRGIYAAATAITFYKSDIYIGGQDGDTPVYWKNGEEVSLCCTQWGIVNAIAVVKKP
ncbi:MAG TPA: IPT/TIG domain-containing protein [Chitinophagaceae bacterium]